MLRRTMDEIETTLPQRHTAEALPRHATISMFMCCAIPCDRASVQVRILPSDEELNAGYLESEKALLKVEKDFRMHVSQPMPRDTLRRWAYNRRTKQLLQQVLPGSLPRSLPCSLLRPRTTRRC